MVTGWPIYRLFQLLSVDLRTKTERELLSVSPPETVARPVLSPDRRWLYYTRARREADIWMATLK